MGERSHFRRIQIKSSLKFSRSDFKEDSALNTLGKRLIFMILWAISKYSG
jgi:hypothetical protein